MNLLVLRDAIVTDIKTRFAPSKLEVKGHAGRFDVADLDSFGVSAPEVRIAVLSAPRTPNGRNCYVEAKLAAYIIAQGDRNMDAGDRGMKIASGLLQYLSGNAPGGGDQPEQLAYQNLYNNETRERGKHLSAVTWSQQIEITGEAHEPDLDDFLTAVATYDYGSAPHATDTINLEPPP